MSSFERVPSTRPSQPLSRALLAGVLASFVYPTVAIAFAVAVGSNFSSGGPGSYPIFVLVALGTIGVPVVLWLRFGYRGPVAVMSVIVVFLTFVAPLVAPGSGDAPAFALVLYRAPFYLVLYGVVTAGERFYRRWWSAEESMGE